MTQTSVTRKNTPPTILWRVAALGVLLGAFALRVKYLTLFFFHIDEYFTLAAAKFIADTGSPRYPVTGYFYDAGLPFSYLDGLLFRWFGFSEPLGRFPAVVFGVLAVATIIWMGRKMLSAPWVGVFAGLMLALNVDSVEWGGRARMITLAQWLALVTTVLIWVGITRYSARNRLAAAVSAGLTLLTHFSTVVLLPAWFAAAGVLWWAKSITITRRTIRDGIILAVLSGAALMSGAFFQPPPSVEFQSSGAGLGEKIAALLGKFLQLPPDFAHAWQVYGGVFLKMPQLPLTILAAIGILWIVYRAVTGNLAHSEKGALFLTAIFATAMAMLVFAVNAHWQRARYLLMQAFGIYYLLGAYGLMLAVQKMLKNSTSRLRSTLGAIAAIFLLLPFISPLQSSMDVGQTGWNRYDLASEFVADHIQPGEKVMTMHPPATQLYIGQTDYYLVQNSPKLIVRADGALADRYTGALWVKNAAEFDAALARHSRTWLVTQEFWLFNSYDGYLQQEILWKMDKQWGEGGVWALSSRADRWTLAEKMAVPVGAAFDGGGKLAGYTISPTELHAGDTIRLTLFWQGSGLPVSHKIFVQFRDADNNTRAQADHLLYDGKVPAPRWEALWENDTALRDGATLVLPGDLPPGDYRIFVGFYHPDTFARVGVVNDQSGEAAVILGPFAVVP